MVTWKPVEDNILLSTWSLHMMPYTQNITNLYDYYKSYVIRINSYNIYFAYVTFCMIAYFGCGMTLIADNFFGYDMN